MYITNPKGMNGGIVRKYWTKERSKPNRSDFKSWGTSKVKGHKRLNPSGFVDSSTLLSLGLVHLCICSSLWQKSHGSSISQHNRVFTFTAPYNSLSRPSYRDSPAAHLALVTLLNRWGRIYNLSADLSSITLKPEPHELYHQIFSSLCCWSIKFLRSFPFLRQKLSRPEGTPLLIPAGIRPLRNLLIFFRRSLGTNTKFSGAYLSSKCILCTSWCLTCSFSFYTAMIMFTNNLRTKSVSGCLETSSTKEI